MDIFGHHVTRRFLVLSCLDGGLFFLLLQGMNVIPQCAGCFTGPILHFDLYEALLLTGGLLLTTTALGFYNDDAVQDVGIFRTRFLFAWQAVLLASVAAFTLRGIGTGVWFGRSVGELSLAISLFMAVMFALHLAAVWCLGLSFMKKRVLVLGDGRDAEALTDFLNGPGCSHFHHVQTVSLWRAPEYAVPRTGNVALAAPVTEMAPLPELAETLRADQIIVAVDNKRGLPVDELLRCKLRGVEVVDSLTFLEREAGVIDAANVGSDWLAFSSGFVFSHRRRVLKRGVDLVLSAAFLAFVLPMCLLVALAIRLESRGPIFYRQERVGLDGKVFQVWKFRSMRADAEKDGVARWATSADDRVTRVGRFIRKVRIDEIPQIINVLAGDMSFIGPRPERPFFVEQLRQLLPHYDLRHCVRPGITGWAQVNYPYGASIEDARRKLAYDLYYLKKNDVLLDFAILVQTIRVVLFAQGAR